MTPEKVQRAERTELIGGGNDILAYKVSFLGTQMMLYYMFDKDSLFRAAYSSVEKYINLDNYINDYNNYREQLVQYHGEAHRIELQWKNDEFKDIPEKQGIALQSGHLVMVSSWVTAESIVTLICMGDGTKISLEITYESKEQGRMSKRE